MTKRPPRGAFLFILLLLISACSLKGPGRIVTSDSGKENFCVVGDVGNGSSVQMKVAEAMKESGCEKLILLGDLIYPHGINDSQDNSLKNLFYDPYADFKNIYIVLGNHDYQGNVGAWKEISSRDGRIIHPSHFFREKIGDICLFFLDTNFHASKELLNEESLWLRKNLHGCKYKAAFSHHPYFNSGSRHGHATLAVKTFFEQEIIGKFDIIFSGHEHLIRDEGVIRGTRQIISGAGGKIEFGASPGFTIFTIDKKDYKKSSYRLIKL